MASQGTAPRTLARLKRQLQRLGITQERVAAEAAKTARFGTMSVPTVSRTFSGRTKSANIVATAKRLIAAAQTDAAQAS